MSETLQFSAHGTPRPKSRPRFIKGRMVSTANPHEKLWKKAVERAAFAAVMYRGDPSPVFRGPVSVRMVFTFAAPKSAPGRIGTPHTQTPDVDNIQKLVLDCMTRAGVFRDDSQVADGPVEKWWGERAGVVVIVEPMDCSAAQAPTAAVEPPPDWLQSSR